MSKSAEIIEIIDIGGGYFKVTIEGRTFKLTLKELILAQIYIESKLETDG